MEKARIQIEVVSVEEAEKILLQEQQLAKRNGKRKLHVVKNSRKSPAGTRTQSTSPGVLTS